MIIHTAWVGPRTWGPDIGANMATQQKFAQRWELWTEQRIAADARIAWVLESPFFKSCMVAKNYSCATDMLRYALLYAMGGMWCDTDVEIIKAPGAIFEWGPRENVHVAYEDEQLIGMAVLYAPPRHPFIGSLLDDYRKRTYADLSEGGGTHGNGPVIMTRAVNEWLKLHSDIDRDARLTMHPTETFYPSSWRSPEKVNVTERTVAWHKWAASWKETADLSKWIYR